MFRPSELHPTDDGLKVAQQSAVGVLSATVAVAESTADRSSPGSQELTLLSSVAPAS